MTDLAEVKTELESILLDLDAAQRRLNNLRDVLIGLSYVAEQEAKTGRLNVTWIGQNTASATDDYTNSDCGAACLAMISGYLFKHLPVTVDEVSIVTGKPRGYTSLSFNDLITAAQHFGIKLQHANLSLDEIGAEIQRGSPVIALVNYSKLPLYYRFDMKYNAGHWVLIVGVDAQEVIYHDPYWPNEQKGSYKQLTRDEFSKAYTTPAAGNQYGCHALRVIA